MPTGLQVALTPGANDKLNLNDGRIRNAVARVTALGGKVLEPAHAIGPHEFRAVVLDSEGNRIALHSTVDA